MTDISKKIELARQMLAKAESTTPEEAEALTAAAEKIILRYGIDEAMLAASDPSRQEEMVKDRTLMFEGRYADARLRSVYSALEAFGTCYFLRVRTGVTTFYLDVYGRKSQVERMVILGASLDAQAMISLNNWWREERRWHKGISTEHQKFIARREHLLGFGEGARVRVLSEKKQVQDETPGAALVLADESALAKEFAKKSVKVSSSRSYRSQDSYSRNQGFEAGRKANVGTTQATIRKQIGARA